MTVVKDLPQVNELVRVSLGDADAPDVSQLASRVPSRVEDVRFPATAGGPTRVLVAAPEFEGDLEAPATGTPCTVLWTSPRGLWVLPVQYRGDERLNTVKVWDLQVDGPPRREERRKFVRVPWSLPFTLELRPGNHLDPDRLKALKAALERAGTGPQIPGHTLNVGEGGLRGLVRDVELPAGLPVLTRIALGEHEFALPSRICWSAATGDDPDLFESALAFDDPTEHGDAIRPLLFAEQLRLRRDGLA